MMKPFCLVILIIFSANSWAMSDQQYYEQVTKVLRKNPQDVKTIYEAGNYFFKRKNYKLAIWYFSSPLLLHHPKILLIKLKYAHALLKLHRYKEAYAIYRYLEQQKLPVRLQQQVERDLAICKQYYVPPYEKTWQELALYGGIGSVTPNTNKDTFQYGGIYYAWSKLQHAFELNIEIANVTFNSAVTEIDYRQNDYVLSYAYFTDDFQQRFRAVFHKNAISVIIDDVYEVTSVIGEWYYYYRPDYYFNILLGYTDFANEISDNQSGFQISPSLVFPLFSTFSGLLRFNYTTISSDAFTADSTTRRGISLESSSISYSSFDIGIKSVWRNFFVNGEMTIGDESYMVKQNGFVVQSCGEEYSKQYKIEIGYNWSRYLMSSVQWSNYHFKDIATNDEFDVSSLKVLLDWKF